MRDTEPVTREELLATAAKLVELAMAEVAAVHPRDVADASYWLNSGSNWHKTVVPDFAMASAACLLVGAAMACRKAGPPAS